MSSDALLYLLGRPALRVKPVHFLSAVRCAMGLDPIVSHKRSKGRRTRKARA